MREKKSQKPRLRPCAPVIGRFLRKNADFYDFWPFFLRSLPIIDDGRKNTKFFYNHYSSSQQSFNIFKKIWKGSAKRDLSIYATFVAGKSCFGMPAGKTKKIP